MAYKPFKMRGTPFQRNFNIGRTESPDIETPLNINLGTALSGIGAKVAGNVASAGGWGAVATKALAAGMSTLKGGYDAYNPKPDGNNLKDALGDLEKEDPDKFKSIMALLLEDPEKTDDDE